jgi:SH3-like domain-containing protein
MISLIVRELTIRSSAGTHSTMNIVGQKLRVTRPYNIQYSDPISVRAGERLTIGRRDDAVPGWRWCTASDGREGWIPVELLSGEEPQTTILQDYSARELQVVDGEEVMIEEARHGWLRVRNQNGTRGWIPADCVKQHGL